MLSNPNTTKDISAFVQRGTAAPITQWYCSFIVNATFASASQGVDQLRSVPFISGAGGAIDTIAFEVVTGGAVGAVGRVGIYEATSDTNLYPGALVVDSGQFDCTTTGVKSATISATLKPNTLYWFAYHLGGATSTLRLLNTTSTPNVMGFGAALGGSSRSGLTGAQAYGALPATYNAGQTFATGGLAAVFVHFS